METGHPGGYQVAMETGHLGGHQVAMETEHPGPRSGCNRANYISAVLLKRFPYSHWVIGPISRALVDSPIQIKPWMITVIIAALKQADLISWS